MALLITGVCLSVLFGLLSVIGFVQSHRAKAELALLAAIPTTAIASTAEHQQAEVSGEVVPSEQGLVVSPASGRQLVHFEVDVYDTAGSTASVEETAVAHREFWIRDAAGSYARILPDGAELVGVELRFASDYFGPRMRRENTVYAPMSASMEAWARSIIDRRRLLVTERAIAPGETLLVQGVGERRPDGTLLFRAGPGRKFVLSTFAEHELASVRREHGKTGLLAATIFLGMTVIGVALTVAGVVFGI